MAAGPSDQSESLLHVLDVYAKALKDLGRLRESAQVRRECAPVAVRMAGSDDQHAKHVAGFCLYQLAETLLDLGEADKAEPWARAAVQVAHALPASPLLAGTLTVWTQALDRIGRRADARAAAAEALRVHREITAATGNRVHLTVAALSLRHLLPEEAGLADPLAELRAEAVRDPALATPVFVGAALQRARDLAARGQREEAGQQMTEALTQARRLAADDPDTYTDSVAAALMESAQLGLSDDPQEALSEAAGMLRQLVRDRDDVSSRVGLALALEHYSVRLRSAGRLEDALQGFTEAIGLLRPSLAQDRWQVAMYLSNVLGLFSETIRARDPEQAVAAVREAIDLEVARTDDHAPAPAERLLLLRQMLFVALTGLMGTQARQGADESVIMAIAREIGELGRSFPAATLDAHDIAMYAGALNVIGELLRNSGSLERALVPLGEAVRVLREHATSNPAWDNTGLLLTTGLSCVGVYRELGRHAEAAQAMADTLADCRRPLPGGNEERLACLAITGAVIDHLPMSGFTAERLRLAVELSRTGRTLPQDLGGQGGTAASALLIFRFLKEVAGTGLLDDGIAGAALEISAGIRFLAEHAPGLLEAEHAEALSFAAFTLSADDLEQALDLSTRAMKLYRSLPADPDGEPMQPHAASLVVHGMVLSRTGRYEDAVQPLEQALPDLLAAGPGISADQLRFLNLTLSLLSHAYRVLRRDDAIQALVAAIEAAGIPDVVREHRPGREPDDEVFTALLTAVNTAAADPARGIAALEEIRDAAARRKDYPVAYAASRYLTAALRTAGRLPEALRSADQQVTYGHQANRGPWTQLYDQSIRLQVRIEAGLDDELILAEATDLVREAEQLPTATAGQQDIDPDWVREALLRSAASAASRLGLWPEALQHIQAETMSLRDRGAPPEEVADAELQAFNALAATGAILEATELLDRCETAFRQADRRYHVQLGNVAQARAHLAALAVDPARAAEQQPKALARFYESGDVAQIQRAHANFSQWLAEADQFSASALLHELAAGVLAELLGQAADIDTITGRLIFRAGDHPATLTLLCEMVDRIPGVRLGELLELSRSAAASPGEIFSNLLRRASDCQRHLFDQFAQHRMEWDPVFAGIVAARQGNISAAQAVKLRLSVYATDRSWSQLSLALGYILRQHPEAAAATSLDVIDQVLLRRCTDALDGGVHIAPELTSAIPIAGVLSLVVQAAQNNQSSPDLARTLEHLAAEEQWRLLASPLRRILAGDRDPQMVAGLTLADKTIISTLLGHLTPPSATWLPSVATIATHAG
jgi:tetratricopeptide (TPR) repeat protein